MARLDLSEVYERLKEIVYSVKTETGVMLVGQGFTVKHLIGPSGILEPAYYEPSQSCEEDEYNRVQKEHPDWTWIGDLHAHPTGMTWLSSTDMETVREIVEGKDDCFHPNPYVCGVLQRVRGEVEAFPRLFPSNEPMDVVYGKARLRKHYWPGLDGPWCARSRWKEMSDVREESGDEKLPEV